MKRIAVCLLVLASLASCQKNEPKEKEIPAVKTFKSAYINTVELMDKSEEAKAIQKKYDAESKTKGASLAKQIAEWKKEAAQFQKNAAANGQEWAQRKGQELQSREEQLGYAQQQLVSSLEAKLGKEMDVLKKKYKDLIKKYGKEKQLDYIYGTGDVNTILYARDSYDITKDIIQKVNTAYAEQKK